MRNATIFFLAVFLFSCSDNIHQEYYSFNSNGWNTDSIIRYQYMIIDTTKEYKLSLNIRHTVDYKFQNLFLFLDGSHKDTIEINLADKNGKWIGSGISDIRELNYVFHYDKVFYKKGEHILSVEQAMRYGAEEKIKNLQQIVDIGLIVSENNE